MTATNDSTVSPSAAHSVPGHRTYTIPSKTIDDAACALEGLAAIVRLVAQQLTDMTDEDAALLSVAASLDHLREHLGEYVEVPR